MKIDALLLFILVMKSIDCTFQFNIYVLYEFTEYTYLLTYSMVQSP